MPTAKELLARTRAKVMRTVDLNASPSDRPRRARGEEVNERAAPEDDARGDSVSAGSDRDPSERANDAKKWKWMYPFRKGHSNRNRNGGTDGGSGEVPDSRRDSGVRGIDVDEQKQEVDLGDVVDSQFVEAYTQEYDDINEDEYRVHQRQNWQSKVAENKYWKKLMRPSGVDNTKKVQPESWDTGLQSLGDVPVSSRYGRRASHHSAANAHHEQGDERNDDTHASDNQSMENFDAWMENENDDNASYESSSSNEHGYDHGEGIGVDENDLDDLTHTSTEEPDDGNSNSRQRRSLRYFVDEEDADVHATSHFSRVSHHSSQYSNSSVMSIGATGLPTNVQPFRWVPYFGGVNGFGHNPFAATRPSFPYQKAPRTQPRRPTRECDRPPEDDGTDDYDMGLRESAGITPGVPSRSGAETSVERETWCRPGSAPWADVNLHSVSPAYSDATSCNTPSPGDGRTTAETPVSFIRRESAVLTPSIYGTTPSSTTVRKSKTESHNASGRLNSATEDDAACRIVQAGQQRFDAQMAAGMVDAFGIGAAAPATPHMTPAVGSFYGPIGTLGIEASEKRRKLEASTGTVGHTARAYRLAAAYPDLANLCENGILMMTRMWCDPTMLTDARRVATPDLPELKVEDGAPKRSTSVTETPTAASARQSTSVEKGTSSTVATLTAAAATPKVKSASGRGIDKKTASGRRASGAGAAGAPQHARQTTGAAHASRVPSRGPSDGVYRSSKNNAVNSSARRGLPGASLGHQGSLHSMMGVSVYSNDMGNNMDSSMLGSGLMADFMDGFDGMEASYVVDDGDAASEAPGEDGSSDSESDSATTTGSFSSSSDDENDGDVGEGSVTFLTNRSARARDGVDESSFATGVSHRVHSLSVAPGRSLPSRPSLSAPSNSGIAKPVSVSVIGTAAAPPADRRTSNTNFGKADSTVTPKARFGSLSVHGDQAYEYGLDHTFDAYVKPLKRSPKADAALAAPQAEPEKKPAAKPTSNGDVAKPTAPVTTPVAVKSVGSTYPVAPARPSSVEHKKAALPSPSLPAPVNESSGGRDSVTPISLSATLRTSAVAAKPTLAVGTALRTSITTPSKAVATTATAGSVAIGPSITAHITPPPSATSSATKGAPSAAMSSLEDAEDIASKHRNLKFLSNDPRGSAHDRAAKLTPLDATPTTTASKTPPAASGPVLPALSSSAKLKSTSATAEKAALPTAAPTSAPVTTRRVTKAARAAVDKTPSPPRVAPAVRAPAVWLRRHWSE